MSKDVQYILYMIAIVCTVHSIVRRTRTLSATKSNKSKVIISDSRYFASSGGFLLPLSMSIRLLIFLSPFTLDSTVYTTT